MIFKTDTSIKALPVKEYISSFLNLPKIEGYCRACHRYSNFWSCPPFQDKAESIMNGYSTIYIIGTRVSPLEKEASATYSPNEIYDITEQMMSYGRSKIDPILLNLEGVANAGRAFFAGSCHICGGPCLRAKGIECCSPEFMRPSLEAYGFDIQKSSSEILGIELKWGGKGRLPEYLTLVSALLCNKKIDNIDGYFINID